jgi:hypothetical protein
MQDEVGARGVPLLVDGQSIAWSPFVESGLVAA